MRIASTLETASVSTDGSKSRSSHPYTHRKKRTRIQSRLLCLLLLATAHVDCGGRADDPATDASTKSVEIDEIRAANQEIVRDADQFQNELDADLREMQEEFAADADEQDREEAELKQQVSTRKPPIEDVTRIPRSLGSDTSVASERVPIPPKQAQDDANPRSQAKDQQAALPSKRADVREHVRDLSDVDKEVRIAACKQIAELGPAGVDATKALTVCVDDEEAEVRNAAVSALAAIGSPAKAAVPSIVEAIAGERLNYTAFASLHAIGGDEALVGLATHEQAQARRWGVRELAQRGDRKMLVKVLEKSILDEDQDVRTLSLDTLNKLTFARDPNPAAPTVPALITLIKRPETTNAWDVHKRSAIWILARFGASAKAAVPTLVKYLDEPFYCDAAMTALGSMGSDAKSAVPKLTELIEGGKLSFTSLKTAILAAGGIGPDAKSAVPAILKAAGINQEAECVRAFGEIGPGAEPAIPYLLKMLNKYRNDERSAKKIAHSLAQIGEPSIGPLVGLLASEDRTLASHAETALVEIGPKAVSAVVEGLSREEDDARASRSAVLAAIASTDSEALTKHLDAVASLFDDSHYKVRLNALTILGHCESVPLELKAKVEKAKDDPESKQVREKATAVLDELTKGE